MRFKNNQRVWVRRECHRGLDVHVMGTVVRLRRADNCAWIALDRLADNPECHPFPAADSRGKHVLASPDDCEALAEDSKEPADG